MELNATIIEEIIGRGVKYHSLYSERPNKYNYVHIFLCYLSNSVYNHENPNIPIIRRIFEISKTTHHTWYPSLAIIDELLTPLIYGYE